MLEDISSFFVLLLVDMLPCRLDNVGFAVPKIKQFISRSPADLGHREEGAGLSESRKRWWHADEGIMEMRRRSPYVNQGGNPNGSLRSERRSHAEILLAEMRYRS